MIEILSSGASNTIQDLGRSGYLNAGVSYSGAMDREALTIANRMIGNDDTAAGIEVSVFPFRLRFLKTMTFAVCGAFGFMTLNGKSLPGWWAARAHEGDVLVLGLPDTGVRSYLAVEGGIPTIPVLGSRSTDLKSGFGGLLGRGLNRGDRLDIRVSRNNSSSVDDYGFGLDGTGIRPDFFGSSARSPLNIRMMAAAEHDLFTTASLEAFYSAVFEISADANRQGYRLNGPKLTLAKPLELFSHGIMPGTIQVPPSGQPVIQMADANTCGGYPKIGCVIAADLWKLAQSGPGQRIRFENVTRQEAVEALQASRKLLREAGVYAELARKDKVRSYVE